MSIAYQALGASLAAQGTAKSENKKDQTDPLPRVKANPCTRK